MTNNFGLARALKLLPLIAAPAYLLAQTQVAKDKPPQVANTGTMGRPFVNSDKDTKSENITRKARRWRVAAFARR